MTVYNVGAGNGEKVARRMVYLAWKACGGPSGMGWLQDRGEQTEDEVWESAVGRHDYPGWGLLGDNRPGRIYCDYVQGRMMKFGLEWTDGTVRFDERANWRSDYQGHSGKYPTFSRLFTAAVVELEIVVARVE